MRIPESESLAKGKLRMMSAFTPKAQHAQVSTQVRIKKGGEKKRRQR